MISGKRGRWSLMCGGLYSKSGFKRIVVFCRDVLGKDIGDVSDAVRAKKGAGCW